MAEGVTERPPMASSSSPVPALPNTRPGLRSLLQDGRASLCRQRMAVHLEEKGSVDRSRAANDVAGSNTECPKSSNAKSRRRNGHYTTRPPRRAQAPSSALGAQARESAIAQSALGFPRPARAVVITSSPDCGADLAWHPMEPGRQEYYRSAGRTGAVAVCVNAGSPTLSSLSKLPRGLQILGLETALSSTPGLVEPYLAKLSLTQKNAFTSLNTAFLRDGVVVIVAPGVVLQEPIELVFASVANGAATVSHPRLLVMAGEASQVTILERYVGQGAAFTNAVGEVWLSPKPWDHYKLQEEPADSFHSPACSSTAHEMDFSSTRSPRRQPRSKRSHRGP